MKNVQTRQALEESRSSFSTYTAEQIQDFRTRWEQTKSASKRYDPSFDIFDDFAEEKVLERTEEHWVKTFFKFSFAGVSAFLGVLAFTLSYLNPEITPFNQGETTLDNILYLLSFGGLSHDLTENNFLLLASLSVAAIVIDRLRVTIAAHTARIRIRKNILRERHALKYRKQIYPGVGPVRFSAGEDGIAIQGDNLDMLFQWGSLDDEIIYIKRDKQSKEFEYIADNLLIDEHLRQTESVDGEPGINASDNDNLFAIREFIDDATHLWILLKPTLTFKRFMQMEAAGEQTGPYAEFFVVPKSFFDDPRAGESWEKFCLYLMKSHLLS